MASSRSFFSCSSGLRGFLNLDRKDPSLRGTGAHRAREGQDSSLFRSGGSGHEGGRGSKQAQEERRTLRRCFEALVVAGMPSLARRGVEGSSRSRQTSRWGRGSARALRQRWAQERPSRVRASRVLEELYKHKSVNGTNGRGRACPLRRRTPDVLESSLLPPAPPLSPQCGLKSTSHVLPRTHPQRRTRRTQLPLYSRRHGVRPPPPFLILRPCDSVSRLLPLLDSSDAAKRL